MRGKKGLTGGKRVEKDVAKSSLLALHCRDLDYTSSAELLVVLTCSCTFSRGARLRSFSSARPDGPGVRHRRDDEGLRRQRRRPHPLRRVLPEPPAGSQGSQRGFQSIIVRL